MGRWSDASYEELSKQLLVHSEWLQLQKGRTPTDATVTALREAARRLKTVSMLKRSIDKLRKRLREEKQKSEEADV